MSEDVIVTLVGTAGTLCGVVVSQLFSATKKQT